MSRVGVAGGGCRDYCRPMPIVLGVTALLCLLSAGVLGAEAVVGGETLSLGLPIADAREITFIQVPGFTDAEVDIDLDGVLMDGIWDQVPGYDGLTVVVPDVMTVPRYNTDVHYFYTEKGLYIGAKMEQPPDTLINRLSGRDTAVSRDGFAFYLDPTGQGLYAYWFRVNLGDSIGDGTMTPERNASGEWDGPWKRATQSLSDGWSAELFLPWSMLPMPEVHGPRNMGFFFDRHVAHLEERWGTPALPPTGSRFLSAFGTMRFEQVDATRQLALFPYASYTYDRIESDGEAKAGLDIFWRPSTNFQTTATLNPDFGTVESDDVVVNLTAFETFYPEKRLFFVEGNEVFVTTPRSRPSHGSIGAAARPTSSSFSPPPITLLNTRRIGGAPKLDLPDDVDMEGVEQSRLTELLGAAKVTGQIGGLRYGVLTAFEDDVQRVGELESADGSTTSPVVFEQDGREFAVLRMLYETSGQGRFSAGYMGTLTRRPRDFVVTGPGGEEVVPHFEDDAIVHGIDTHLLSRDGKINWETQLMTSAVDGERGYGALMDINYVPNRTWHHDVRLDFVDADLDINDLGYIQRNDVWSVVYSLNYDTGHGLERLRRRKWSLVLSEFRNTDGQRVRGGAFWRNSWLLKNNTEISSELVYFPKSWDDRDSRDNGTFRVEDRWLAEVGVGTALNRAFSVSLRAGVRQESLGDWTYRVDGGFTFKPNNRFSVDLDVEYFNRDGWLVHQEDRDFTTYKATDWQPRLAADYFITARQQIRLSLQWAGIRAREQEFWRVPPGDGRLVPRPPGEESEDFTISRLTAQLRYRWEIAPLSDLFVVYTRGSNLDSAIDDDFGKLFTDALKEPVLDTLVIKLRYRFGS